MRNNTKLPIQRESRARDGGDEPSFARLVDAVDRLVRVGVALTTRALSEQPGVEATVQQWRVLVLVAEGGPLRVGEIAHRVGLSVPSASRLVTRLDSAGLATSHPDPEDRRATLVDATASGRSVVASVIGRRRTDIAAALRGVDAPEPATIDALAALAAVLDTLA